MMDPGIEEDARYNPAMNGLPSSPSDEDFQQLEPDLLPEEPQNLSITFSEPAIITVISPEEKAPVCCNKCNCCNCTYEDCGKIWAIANFLQILVAIVMLIVNDLILDEQAKKNKDKYSLECNHFSQMTGSPASTARLSTAVGMLLIYTVGSIFFALAVFYDDLILSKRSLFVLFFLCCCGSFPLGAIIPTIIDAAVCPSKFLEFDTSNWKHYVGHISLVFEILVWLVLMFFDVRISLIYRRWLQRQHNVNDIEVVYQSSSTEVADSSPINLTQTEQDAV